MTEQEAFNKVYSGLRAQNFERSSNGVGCLLRDKLGRKCAIGQLISDEDYALYGEVQPLSLVDLLPGVFEDLDRAFITNLISAHDNSPAPILMKNALTNIALMYGLTIPQEENHG